MNVCEIIRGTVNGAEHYAYLAIRPPLVATPFEEFQIGVDQRVGTLGMRTEIEGEAGDESMVFEIQTNRVVDEEYLNQLTSMLRDRSSAQFSGSIILPHILAIEGEEPLFSQYEARWQTARTHS